MQNKVIVIKHKVRLEGVSALLVSSQEVDFLLPPSYPNMPISGSKKQRVMPKMLLLHKLTGDIMVANPTLIQPLSKSPTRKPLFHRHILNEKSSFQLVSPC